MINLPCFFFFLQIFRKKKVLIYIYDYVNELICIFEYGIKGQCFVFIWYQICHSIVNTGCDMINLLCIPS